MGKDRAVCCLNGPSPGDLDVSRPDRNRFSLLPDHAGRPRPRGFGMAILHADGDLAHSPNPSLGYGLLAALYWGYCSVLGLGLLCRTVLPDSRFLPIPGTKDVDSCGMGIGYHGIHRVCLRLRMEATAGRSGLWGCHRPIPSDFGTQGHAVRHKGPRVQATDRVAKE